MIKYFTNKFSTDAYWDIPWDKPVERIFNGKLVQGRPTKGYGTQIFEYAGKTYTPEPWTTQVESIKKQAEELVLKELGKKLEFSFCLCGYYGTDGKGIPHHSDTVPTLEDIVVSISFGAPRLFVQRTYQKNIKNNTNTSLVIIDKENKVIEEERYVLENGDVLLFDGHNQMNSTHAVLDAIGAKERINLTFRSGI